MYWGNVPDRYERKVFIIGLREKTSSVSVLFGPSDLVAEKRKKTRVLILALFMCIHMSLANRAQAGLGSFLESIGVGAAFGAVLGASTLPFYDKPSEHTGNIAVGAAIGAAVGLGLSLGGLITGAKEEEKYPLKHSSQYQDLSLFHVKVSKSTSAPLSMVHVASHRPRPMGGAAVLVPVLSLSW